MATSLGLLAEKRHVFTLLAQEKQSIDDKYRDIQNTLKMREKECQEKTQAAEKEKEKDDIQNEVVPKLQKENLDQISNLQNQLEKLEREKNDLDQIHGRLADIRGVVKSSAQEIQLNQKTISDQQTLILDLQSKVESQEKISLLSKEANDKEISFQKDTIDNNQKTISQQEETMKKNAEEITSQSDIISNHKNEISLHEITLKQVLEKIKKNQITIEEQERETLKFQEKSTLLQKEIMSFHTECKAARDSLQPLDASMMNAKEQILASETVALQRQLEEAKALHEKEKKNLEKNHLSKIETMYVLLEKTRKENLALRSQVKTQSVDM